MNIQTEELLLPEYCLSALINGDYSGMSNDDEIILNRFLISLQKRYSGYRLNFSVSHDDYPSFKWRHSLTVFGWLADDCLPVTLNAISYE